MAAPGASAVLDRSKWVALYSQLYPQRQSDALAAWVLMEQHTRIYGENPLKGTAVEQLATMPTPMRIDPAEILYAIRLWMQRKQFSHAESVLREELLRKFPELVVFDAADARREPTAAAAAAGAVAVPVAGGTPAYASFYPPDWLVNFLKAGVSDMETLFSLPPASVDPALVDEVEDLLDSSVVGALDIAEPVDVFSMDPYEELRAIANDDQRPIADDQRSVSLDQLIFQLTFSTNPSFSRTFWLTYPSFVSPQQLFRKLRQCLLRSPERQGRIRVLNTIKHWINQCRRDIDAALEDDVRVFIQTEVAPDEPTTANSLMHALQAAGRAAAAREAAGLLLPLPVPEPKAPLSLVWIPAELFPVEDIEPEEFARQITVADHEMFRAVGTRELLGCNWSNPGQGRRSANILRLVRWSSQLTQFVAAQIVGAEELRVRARRYGWWTRVAECVRQLANFNSLMSILAALQIPAVARLKFTKEEVAKKLHESVEQLTLLMDSDASFKRYRGELKRIPPPCMPYVGLFLKDLQFIEQNNVDFLDGDRRAEINWKKRQFVGEVLQLLVELQQTPYALHPVTQIQTILEWAGSQSYDVDALYAQSLQREPRNCRKEQLV